MHPPLVGRDAELAAIDAAIVAASQGRGSSILLAGEPGIGKTSLARALSERAALAGFEIAWGRVWEAGGAPPYWPWIEILRALLPLGADGFRAHATGTMLGLLGRLVPELGATAAIGELDSATQRFITGEAVLGLISAAAQVKPLVIVLDDLHAADRGTLDVLRFVMPRLRAQRVVLCGSYRDAEARLSHEVGLALAHAARDAETLTLARLDAAAVARLVAATRGDSEASDARLTAAISATSEGNPLFVVEMLRLWRAQPGRSGRMPDTVVDVLHQRLALLSPATRRLLELAATQGREFDVAWLSMSAAAPEAVVREALEEAAQADIAVERDAARGAFTHVLIRDALYRELGAGGRAAAHLACAEALERGGTIDPRVRALNLAHHFLEAAAGGAERAHAKALSYARTAAERAVELQAHEDSVALLRRALTLVEGSHDVAGRDHERAQVMLALGLAYIRAEQFVEGNACCQAVAAIARTLRDAELLAQAALTLGVQLRWGETDRAMLALLEEALAAGPALALRARLLARLAAALQPAAEPEVPMRLAREALSLANDLDAATRLEVLVAAGSALLYFAEPMERQPLNLALVALAGALGDKVRLARGLVRLVFDHFELGEVAAADRYIAAHAALASELALPTLAWMMPLVRASRAALVGDFDAAESALNEAKYIADQIQAKPGAPFAALRVAIARGRGCPDSVAEAELLATLAPFLDPWYLRAARVGFAAAHVPPAELAGALALIAPDLAQWRGRVSATWLGEACAVVKDRAFAEALYPLLLPLAQRNHVWGVGLLVCEGPISETLGRIALVLERPDDARVHFAMALARVEQMGATPLATRIRRRIAALDERAPAQAHTTIESRVSGATWSLVGEGEVWSVTFAGRRARFKDSRGLRILAELVARPGSDIHVFELLGQDEARTAGDAGERLDRASLQAYRERIADLERERDEARAWSDGTRGERAEAELEALRSEVARAFGIGGRVRKDGSQAERARINVRRRLVDAIERITAELPDLAHHLERSLKTGVVCAYAPAPDDPITHRAP